MSDQLLPFQRLGERLQGIPYKEVLQSGVPGGLERPLREWISSALTLRETLATRVCIRLGIAPIGQVTYAQTLAGMSRADLLLEIADAILQLHPDWEHPDDRPSKRTQYGVGRSKEVYGRSLAGICPQLTDLLADAGSELGVDIETRRLTRRVDETVARAMVATVKSAADDAGDHLRQAWAAAYGLSPDPDATYRECVRAVEAVACPLILKKQAASGKATLGTVIGDLKNNPTKWELAFVDKDNSPRDASHITEMMDLLWQGQVSRHAGGANNRRQTQAEAEAAVHLAVILVQWLTSGVLKQRP